MAKDRIGNHQLTWTLAHDVTAHHKSPGRQQMIVRSVLQSFARLCHGGIECRNQFFALAPLQRLELCSAWRLLAASRSSSARKKSVSFMVISVLLSRPALILLAESMPETLSAIED